MNDSDNELLHSVLTRFFKQRGRDDRRVYISLWLGDVAVCEQLNYETVTSVFVPQMVSQMRMFGEIESGVPALARILEGVRDLMGVDVKGDCDQLIERLLNDRTTHWRIIYRHEDDAHRETMASCRAALTQIGMDVKIVRCGEGF